MSRHHPRARTGEDRTSLYDDITNKIIAELEAGRVPWVQPWGTAAARAPLAMPKSAATGRQYSGVNILILWGAATERAFTGQSWLTFRQALSLGGHVRKGERGTTVVYADRFVPVDEQRRASENGEEAQTISVPQALHTFQHRSMRGLASGDRNNSAASAARPDRAAGRKAHQGDSHRLPHRRQPRLLCADRRLCAGAATASLFRADQLASNGLA
ncbi:antirestriction protein ArdC [Bradyrhizobium sp. GM0.4]